MESIYNIYNNICIERGHLYNILTNIFIDREANDMSRIFEKTSVQRDSNLNLHIAY